MQEQFDKIKKEYNVDIKKHETDKKILYLSLDDGRKYKLQLLSFMEFHSITFDSEEPETDLFKRGLERLYPQNEQSPQINEDYCDENKKEGFMWSLILRRLLSRG